MIIPGDCLNALRAMPSESVDSLVCDPPYGLGKPPPVELVLRAWVGGERYQARGGGFMGKDWDAFVPGPEVWREVCRVLKPGGHAVIFAGTRTVDWMGIAVRLGGLEIRDCIGWCYYSGFPKSLDVSKAIDAAAGAEREVVGPKLMTGTNRACRLNPDNWSSVHLSDGSFRPAIDRVITAPATPDARRWSGWGTALKPAIEPAILARKPFAATVAENVLKHGTGAINVDGCRFAPGDLAWVGPDEWQGGGVFTLDHRNTFVGANQPSPHNSGRWPANLYACPKAPRAERERGCDGLPERTGAEAVDREPGSAGMQSPRAGAARKADAVRNYHPTVKPIRLMRWLCRLVTPPGGLVVDPFAGSGSTGVAAALEGFAFIGCELDPGHVAIAEARIGHASRHPEEWADTAPGVKRKPRKVKIKRKAAARVAQLSIFGER